MSASERPLSSSNNNVAPNNRKVSFEDKKSSEYISTSPITEESEVKVVSEGQHRGRAGLSRRSPPPVGNEDNEEVTDLVLIIHGIGQGVRS